MRRVSTALLVCIGLLTCATAGATTFVPTDDAILDGESVPTATGEMQFPGHAVTDGLIEVEPLTGLPQPLEVGLWPQMFLPTPGLTTHTGYHVYRARGVSTIEDFFGGPVRARMHYSESEFYGSETQLRLFSFSLTTGLWTELPSVVSTGSNVVFAQIQGPALIGLGHPMPAVPGTNPWALVALALALVAAATWALRRARTIAVAVGLIALAVMMGRGARGSAPEVTNPGNKAINHSEKVEAVTKFAATYNGDACTGMKVKYKWWQYKGTGDPTNAANWTQTPQTQEMIKEGHPTEKGAADDPGITGATPDRAYDNDTDPWFDCAGYALRSSGYIPIDPNGDGKAIIDNEYTCKGAADAGGYQVGDVVTYKKDGKITHYAVVDEVDNAGKIKKLKSKWGKGRLMKHDLTSVPASYGSADQVYRKN